MLEILRNAKFEKIEAKRKENKALIIDEIKTRNEYLHERSQNKLRLLQELEDKQRQDKHDKEMQETQQMIRTIQSRESGMLPARREMTSTLKRRNPPTALSMTVRSGRSTLNSAHRSTGSPSFFIRRPQASTIKRQLDYEFDKSLRKIDDTLTMKLSKSATNRSLIQKRTTT